MSSSSGARDRYWFSTDDIVLEIVGGIAGANEARTPVLDLSYI